MITGNAQVTNPDSVSLTISITAPVKDWKAIVATLGTRHPDWEFSSVISKAITATVGHVERFTDAEASR